MATRRKMTDSPFDTLEKTFSILCAGPRPLVFAGNGFAGLPERDIALDELKAMLLHPSLGFDARDAVIGELVAPSPA